MSGTRPLGRPWLKRSAAAVSFLILLAGGFGWYGYQRLDGNINVDSATAAELLRYEKERPPPNADGAQNILLIGSDNRGGGNSRYGRNTGVQRSDTTILMHLAADRRSATAVSLPRDLMVRAPSCRRPEGGRTSAGTIQFNTAFAFGGAACTIRVVEKLTGVRVDHHVIIDFNGFTDMVDAIGGVEICVRKRVHDRAAGLSLRAGRQTLHGEQALGYVRARKQLGGGSDTERMERQQEFLASMVNRVQSSGVLLNPMRLGPLLDAATESLTTDPGLSSLAELYDMTRRVRDVPRSHVRFLTVPREPHHANPNRDELVQPDAGRLFAALRADRLVRFVSEDHAEQREQRPKRKPREGADIKDEGALPTTAPPTFEGTTPTDSICR